MLFCIYIKQGGSNERPQKITKLAIEADKEEEQYEYITRVLCFLCGPGGVEIEDSKEVNEGLPLKLVPLKCIETN